MTSLPPTRTLEQIGGAVGAAALLVGLGLLWRWDRRRRRRAARLAAVTGCGFDSLINVRLVKLAPHSPYFGPGFLATLQLMATRDDATKRVGYERIHLQSGRRARLLDEDKYYDPATFSARVTPFTVSSTSRSAPAGVARINT